MTDTFFLFGYQDGQNMRLGLQKNDTLYSLNSQAIPSFTWLMQNLGAAELLDKLNAAIGEVLPPTTKMSLKGIIQEQPIWAAGVTYKISEEARERESANSTVYTRVYSAVRPEVFWKSIGHEIVSHQDNVGIRYDAIWSVPEPELTIVFNARMEVIGFTIGNDMSSRDIEGENPLYLPQAKVYDDSCALGPRIWLQPNANEWPQIEIQIEIERSGQMVFSGSTSTGKLHRRLPELADYLSRCKRFPYGVLLMTGTGVVPPDEFSLQAGDIVRIKMPSIGELVNPVVLVGSPVKS